MSSDLEMRLARVRAIEELAREHRSALEKLRLVTSWRADCDSSPSEIHVSWLNGSAVPGYGETRAALAEYVSKNFDKILREVEEELQTRVRATGRALYGDVNKGDAP